MKLKPTKIQDEYGKCCSVFVIQSDQSLANTTILSNGHTDLKVWKVDIEDNTKANVNINSGNTLDFITYKELINTDWESFI